MNADTHTHATNSDLGEHEQPEVAYSPAGQEYGGAEHQTAAQHG